MTVSMHDRETHREIRTSAHKEKRPGKSREEQSFVLPFPPAAPVVFASICEADQRTYDEEVHEKWHTRDHYVGTNIVCMQMSDKGWKG